MSPTSEKQIDQIASAVEDETREFLQRWCKQPEFAIALMKLAITWMDLGAEATLLDLLRHEILTPEALHRFLDLKKLARSSPISDQPS